MYEQNSFVPVARVVQLASHLQQKRLANIAYETRRFVRIGESDVVINQRIADKSQPILKIYHYHCNHLGTPQELTGQDGDVVWLSYDRAWGGSFDSLYKQQFVDNFAISENELQPFKFQGQSLDTETGLHYNRFRYYDSDVGMFVQRDPIELLGGSNTFQYVPNPTGWIDPLGLQKKSMKTPSKDCCKVEDDPCPRREHSQTYEQALKKALAWLELRGFKAERVNLSKFTKKPYGMMNNAGNVGFRVEYDEKCGAHINVFDGKEVNDPHFTWDGTNTQVNSIVKRFNLPFKPQGLPRK